MALKYFIQSKKNWVGQMLSDWFGNVMRSYPLVFALVLSWGVLVLFFFNMGQKLMEFILARISWDVKKNFKCKEN